MKKCRHDIEQGILDKIYFEREVNVTNIVQSTTSPYPEAMNYIISLTKRKFIKVVLNRKGKEVYKITKKGMQYLSHLNALKIIEDLK